MKYATYDAGPICYVQNPDRPWEVILAANRCYADGDAPETGSVQEYIVGHCETHLATALCEQICSGRLKPVKGTYKVPQPDDAGASSAYIAKVFFSQKSETVVHLEVLLIATLEIYARLGDMTVADQREEWFSISGVWDLSDETSILPDWGQFTVYKKKDRSSERGLDEYLVPVMNNNARQLEAARMLERYFPEALEHPIALNPRILAGRMGLAIRYLPLEGKDAYLAMLFCRDSEARVIDRETGEIVSVCIPKNTIVLNAMTVGAKETCKAAKAIIHECIHSFSHRLFWLFQRMYCAELAYFTCPVDVEKTFGSTRDPLHWLESQADALTRAVQIPADTVRKEAEKRLACYSQSLRQENRAGVMRHIIHDLSGLYGVAKKQMRKRLIELGYEDAVGACDWVDGGYVPPYCFAPGSLGKNQTYTIGWEALIKLSDENVELHRLMSVGSLVFIENHLCINQDEFIARTSDGFVLTEYARAHMDACCLRFDVNYRRGVAEYEEGVLHSELTLVDKEYSINTDNLAAIMDLKRKVLADARRLQNIKNTLPADGAGTLFDHMKRQRVTVEQLAELIHVSEMSIKKWRKDDENVPSLRTAVAICIALHLEPELSADYLMKLGISFRLTEDHRMLKYVLEKMYLSSVEACNAFLTAVGYRPLLKEESAAV